MQRTTHKGFTLVELLVAIAITGILLGIGVPSFSNALKESRISSQYNNFVSSLYLARSEAIKGPGEVTICPRQTVGAEQCGTDKDWRNGWIVFIDSTTTQGEATAKIDAGDEIINLQPSFKGDNTITVFGSPTNSASDARAVSYVRYIQTGGAQWASGSIIICDSERGASASRSINVVLTGDIRRGRPAKDSDIPLDVFNRPISTYCLSSA